MIIFDGNSVNLPAGIPDTAVALGYFDGIHLGHQAVIKAAGSIANEKGLALAVFTFSMGEKPGVADTMLLTQRQRKKLLEELGVSFCFQPPFSSLRSLSPNAFFEDILYKQYRAKALACGEDFAFGANRTGDISLLRRMGEQRGVQVCIAPTALYKGAPISSSRIRQCLTLGQIEEVNAMLGQPYEIDFPVVHGQKLGGKLGFPTLNQIFPQGMLPPQQGVYITQTLLDGKWWPSTTGYGSRPTLNGESPTCETFIPGFSGDLYGKEIPIRFHKYVSPNIKFASLQQLADAVQGWAKQAEAYFA